MLGTHCDEVNRSIITAEQLSRRPNVGMLD